jgi:LacI family transcriptional regulator
MPSSRHVAVLIETDDSWGRSAVRGIADYAISHGPWSLLVDPRAAQGGMLLPRGWQGNGVIARIGSRRLLDQLRRKGVPVVDVETIMRNEPGIGRVNTDDAKRAALALDHLLERGFTHFAHYAEPRPGFPSQPGLAFEVAVAARRHECRVYRASEAGRADRPWLAEQQRIARWLATLPAPTAVFVADSHCGRRVLDACQIAGLDVPQQIAVIAGDADDLMCEVSTPPLSSVELACRRIGYLAAGLLDRLMAGTAPPAKPILVPPLRVIARQSTDLLAIDDPELVAAIRHIRSHACGRLHVRDVVQTLAVSRRLLEQRFHAALGHGPAEEIRRVRLERAVELLAHSELPVEQVARVAGFRTATRLGVAFRKQFGLPPSQWRASRSRQRAAATARVRENAQKSRD